MFHSYIAALNFLYESSTLKHLILSFDCFFLESWSDSPGSLLSDSGLYLGYFEYHIVRFLLMLRCTFFVLASNQPNWVQQVLSHCPWLVFSILVFRAFTILFGSARIENT